MTIKWEEQAVNMIQRVDGKKDPKEVIVDAVEQLIEEHLLAFGYAHGILVPTSDPAEGIEYAKMRLKIALNRSITVSDRKWRENESV